jgi:hypothetical protein
VTDGTITHAIPVSACGRGNFHTGWVNVPFCHALRHAFQSGVSVPEHPLHFGPETSITTPLWSKGLGFGLSLFCILRYADMPAVEAVGMW